jgi:type I restriction enzyme, S subunit
MKHSWPHHRIGDVFERQYIGVEIDDFTTYKRVTVRSKGQGIGLRDTAEGLAIGTKKQYSIQQGQFLLSKIDAMNGSFGIVPEECDQAIITGNFWTYDFDENILNRTYLRYLCKGQVFTEFSRRASSGTTNRKYLDEEKFYNLEIPLPPLAEQKSIVAKLETVRKQSEEIKKLRKEQEKDMKNLLYSRYTEIIEGAEWKPMGEVCPVNRKPVTVEPEKEYKELGIRSFGRGTFIKPTFKGIDLTWQKPYWLTKGDLLFSNIKAWEGAVGLVSENEDGFVGSHRYITCKPDTDQIDPEFLLYYLLTSEGVERLSLASPGSADRNRTLSMKRLEKIEVPVPDLALQQEFAELQANVKSLRTEQAASAEELQSLFPALLNKAFEGELLDTETESELRIAAEPEDDLLRETY